MSQKVANGVSKKYSQHTAKALNFTVISRDERELIAGKRLV